VLAGAEGRHATTVRRLSAGERADLTDGVGTIAECVVKSARPGALELAVLARRKEPAPDPRVVIVQAIPKGDRGELAVETMTEVGVDVVVPWSAERCVVRWRGDRADKGVARWRSTALAAAKQSRRSWFPQVTAVAGIAAVAELVQAAALALLLDPDAPQALASVATPTAGAGIGDDGARDDGARDIGARDDGARDDGARDDGARDDGGRDDGGRDIVLVVGPEGGISEQEAALLTQAGAIGARLGPTVLRASSAGAVAAALIMSSSGRWA
jgi:16S rRNA (uracil1498-N3)-methyltransferase